MTIKGYFYVPIYDAYVHIIVSDNIIRNINAHLRHTGDKPITECPSAYCVGACEKKPGYYYMFFDKESLSVNHVNHEKSHLIEFILTACGIRPKDEVRSYLDGYVSGKINDFFKRRKIKLQ